MFTRHSHVYVVQWQKKRAPRAELLCCILFKPVAFLASRFRRCRRCLKPRANERNISLRASFQGALAAGREKERELATTSLKFENLHRKSRGEMLIGGDDVSYDVITPWHVFFNVCLHSRSFPLLADWRKSDSSVDGEPQGNWRWNSNSRHVVASSPSFSHDAARAPRRACSQTNSTLLNVTRCIRLHTLLHVVACCWELFCKVWNRSNVWKQCCELLRPFSRNFKSWLRFNINVTSVALNVLNS